MDNIKVFKDLSNYSRNITPYELEDVINIGWEQYFEQKAEPKVENHDIEKLMRILEGNSSFNAIVEPIREKPECVYCGVVTMQLNNGNSLANGELWIPSIEGNSFYASPMIIVHNICVHGYSPPEEYMQAIRNLDLTRRFNADDLYHEKLEKSGWYESDQFKEMRESILKEKSN